MKIDLHVHTSQRSSCSLAAEEDLIAAAIQAGIDAIVLSDHECLPPPGHVERLSHKYAPFRVFAGIELTTDGEHVVVVGLEDPALATRDWSYADLWHFVEEREGFLFLAHPFRYHDEVKIDVESFPPGGIEINSQNMGEVDPARLDEFIAAHGLRPVANSDAHRCLYVGIYHNILEGHPQTASELTEVLRDGRFAPGRMEERIELLKRTGERHLR